MTSSPLIPLCLPHYYSEGLCFLVWPSSKQAESITVIRSYQATLKLVESMLLKA